jgi:hypothetical protein
VSRSPSPVRLRLDAEGRKRQLNDLSFLSDMWFHRLRRAKAFLDTSPLPLVTSPTRISPRRPSRCGRSHAISGSPCRPTRHPSARRSRGNKNNLLLGVASLSALGHKRTNRPPAKIHFCPLWSESGHAGCGLIVRFVPIAANTLDYLAVTPGQVLAFISTSTSSGYVGISEMT